MSTNNTETTPKEKSQYVILSYNPFKAKKGTLTLKNNRISFTDYDGNTTLDVAITDIQKYKHNTLNLDLFTSGKRYKFSFVPSDQKKLQRNTWSIVLHPGISKLSVIERQVDESGIMTWVRLLKKLGVPDGRRNGFAYSLLFVIFPVLIFTSIALYGNLAGLNATSAPRSYTELLVELMIVMGCFAGFAYVIKTIRKNA